MLHFHEKRFNETPITIRKRGFFAKKVRIYLNFSIRNKWEPENAIVTLRNYIFHESRYLFAFFEFLPLIFLKGI